MQDAAKTEQFLNKKRKNNSFDFIYFDSWKLLSANCGIKIFLQF